MLMKKFSAKIILLGSRGDRDTAELIRHSAGEGIVNAAGETGLLEAMALISKCALFLSNDSGLMHVAGALGIPTIAIFGSTNPITTSPPGLEFTDHQERIVLQSLPEKGMPDRFSLYDLHRCGRSL